MIRTSFVLSWPVPDVPAADRPRYWGLVAEIALRVKDAELARGLNKDGKPLPGVKASTRRRRRSEMTPTGKGDPDAPYLMPGRGLSRTRSLLAAKARKDGVLIWWRFDAWTGGEWGRILRYHALRGKAYDVIGLSPAGIAAVKREADSRWRKGAAPTSPAPGRRPLPIPQAGRTNLDWVDLAVDDERAADVRRAFEQGRASGFLSSDEWRRVWRSGRSPGTLARPSQTSASVRDGNLNRILEHTWNVRPPDRPTVLGRVKSWLTRALQSALGG